VCRFQRWLGPCSVIESSIMKAQCVPFRIVLVSVTKLLLLTFPLSAQNYNTITFPVIPNQTYGNGPVTLAATASSGLPVQYSSSDSNVIVIVTNPVADVLTSLGRFEMELLQQAAPNTVASFIEYATNGSFSNTFVHRSVPGFVIQTGGYKATNNLDPIASLGALDSEYSLSNIRGAVAMALSGTDSNSATSQWFVNLTNNSAVLDSTNRVGNPPFTVFARVLGKGMNIADAIAVLPIYNLGAPFGELPTVGVTNNQKQLFFDNLVTVNVSVVNGPSMVIVGQGTVTITASQLGNSIYPAAEGISRTFAVVPTPTPNSKPQPQLGAFTISSKAYGGSPFVLTPPKSQSKGAWSYSSSNPDVASVSGNKVMVKGVGTAVITATQAASVKYNSATTSANLVISKGTQKINFTLPATKKFTMNGVIALKGTDSVGLPITYISGNTNCLTISGSSAVMMSKGKTTITASQAGDENYNAAKSIVRTITLK